MKTREKVVRKKRKTKKKEIKREKQEKSKNKLADTDTHALIDY